MIDYKERIIYYDHSGGSTFQACKEKHRLGYFMGWRQNEEDPKLSFGHAIHAGWAAYYDALAGGYRDMHGNWQLQPGIDPVVAAQAAFLRDLRVNSDGTLALPLLMESEDRRNVERGMALLRAYIKRWKNEPYQNIIQEDGSPLTEVRFRFHLADYDGFRIIHVGIIDRVMLNLGTGRPIIIEGKTTQKSLKVFKNEVKPNNQITTYFKPANEIATKMGLPEIKEAVWDCMFISDRQPDMNRGLTDPGWRYGISTFGDKKTPSDFERVITTRSRTDVTELLIDAESVALDYAKWLLSGVRRWPRSTGACHLYSGCQFRRRCSYNLDEIEEQAFMEQDFHVERWEPWKKPGNGSEVKDGEVN